MEKKLTLTMKDGKKLKFDDFEGPAFPAGGQFLVVTVKSSEKDDEVRKKTKYFKLEDIDDISVETMEKKKTAHDKSVKQYTTHEQREKSFLRALKEIGNVPDGDGKMEGVKISWEKNQDAVTARASKGSTSKQ